MQVGILDFIYTESVGDSDAPHVVLNRGGFGFRTDLVGCLMLTQTAQIKHKHTGTIKRLYICDWAISTPG